MDSTHLHRLSISDIDRLNDEAWVMQTDDSRTAFGLAKEAHGASVGTNHAQGIRLSLRTMAVTALDMGLHAEAFEYAIEAARLFSETGDQSREALMQNVLGGVHYYLGDHHSRLQCNLRGLELCRLSNDRPGLLRALNNTADTYTRLGEYAKAMAMFKECLALADDSTPFIRCIVLSNMGEVKMLEGDLHASAELIARSQTVGEQIDYREIIVANLIMLARISISEKDADNAIVHLSKAQDLINLHIGLNDRAQIHKWMSEAHALKGNFRDAYENHRLFYQLSQEHLDEQKVLEIKSMQFRSELSEIQQRMTRELEEKVIERTREIELARKQIEQQAKDIHDSIDYARYIQDALLPTEAEFCSLFPENMTLYLPRDVVSGDFFWIGERHGLNYLAVADCTGHGVPGALLSVLGVEKLEQALLLEKEPGAILSLINKEVRRALRQSDKHSVTISRDGMDMALVSVDMKTGVLKYAGAKRPLVIGTGQRIETKRPTRFSIGGHSSEIQSFEQHETVLNDGDTIYLFTDGYADQFGGPNGRKFTSKQLLDWFEFNHKLAMKTQTTALLNDFLRWKGELPQLDDVLVVGVRFTKAQ